MKSYIFDILFILSVFSACNQGGSNVLSYPLQEDRALVGVPNAKGEMAYLIVNSEQEVVSYIHLENVQLDTVYRDGKLAFWHKFDHRSGYIDLNGHEHWLEEETPEPPVQNLQEQQRPKPNTSVIVHTTDWQKVLTRSPFYEEAKKTFAGGLDVTDVANRQLILDYVEQLRKSYTTKDINFIEQVFSNT